MYCTVCATKFTFFQKEKGCPSCGFSFCSKCLRNKVYLEKLKLEVLVCDKCKNSQNNSNPKFVEPPAAYKRMETENKKKVDEDVDQKIFEKLSKLKEGGPSSSTKTTDEEIAKRLQRIREVPTTSTSDIQSRLAGLKGIPTTSLDKPVVPILPNKRTEQEQVNDLMKQYAEEHKIDAEYTNKLDKVFNDLTSRLNNLKGGTSASTNENIKNEASDDEEEAVKKIVEKLKEEAKFDDIDEIGRPTSDELTFCEICNEDATCRCLGCHYLFCKNCFNHHSDDDDCGEFESYPKS